jgi:cytochrome c-type biogenesis protein CcmH
VTRPMAATAPARSTPSATSPWRRRLPALMVFLALVATAATLTAVGVHSPPAGGPAEQVQQIASGLRCPVCKDLSAADSPAPLARQMRLQIAQQVAAGRSEQQIRQGFVAAYGESVLTSPPHTGLGQTVYLLPVLLMGLGLVVVVTLLRRWRQEPEPIGNGPSDDAPGVGDLSPSDQDRVDQALRRLREDERR